MLRVGGATVELAVVTAGAGGASVAGAPTAGALVIAVGVVVVLGVVATMLAGGTPARRALGYRVEGVDGGRPPWWGVVLRELVRPLVIVGVVATGGVAGALVHPRRERRIVRVTRTLVVGRPRREGAAAVSAVGAVVAVTSGVGTVAVWGSAPWDAALVLAWTAAAAGVGAALVALAREEVRHLEQVGELRPVEEVALVDVELPTVWDVGWKDTGAEVRPGPAGGEPGRPDVLVSPRGSVATHKRRRA